MCIVEPGAFKTGIIDPNAQQKRLEDKVKGLPDEIKKSLPDDYISQCKYKLYTVIIS